MFCYQCEQTFQGKGCEAVGVCGKDPETAALQDLLVHATKGIAQYVHRAGEMGARDNGVDGFILDALFTTVTNVNFDPERMQSLLTEAFAQLVKSREMYVSACTSAGRTPEQLNGATQWRPATTLEGLVRQGQDVSITSRIVAAGDEVTGLQELILYGLKGAASYADHARRLGKEDPELYAGLAAALDFLTKQDATADELLGWCLKTGEINYRAMELLDAANTDAYGHPEPTQVRVEPVTGKAILVSGHDLMDLEELLKQTEGKGINVYTHGEMLPALAYPKLKAYPHLVGNYGGAWQRQISEFDKFPGAILMTTNCIQKPAETYFDRIFTTGVVAWPGVRHISNGDFAPVIEAALAQPGFAEDGPDKRITIGFGHKAVLDHAGAIVEAVKSGALKHFFLIGGCDGARPGRNYYTDLAKSVPSDCAILTLACGKFRFNKLDFGDIGGIPRLLDIGQCNDAYSAIQIAVGLADAFECGVNDLPLSLVLSWYEQKAVAILLTLLHLGITNIRIGPTLPAFVPQGALQVLVDQFGLKPISTPEQDLAAMLN